MAETPKDSKATAAANSKPVMDVSHPGKTPPSPNSKSVIVPTRPIMKDPMFNQKDPAGSADTQGPSGSVKIKVEPISAPPLDAKPELKIIKSASDNEEEAVKPKAEAELESKPEPEVETKPDPDPNAETEQELETETTPAKQPDPKPEPDTVPETKTDEPPAVDSKPLSPTKVDEPDTDKESDSTDKPNDDSKPTDPKTDTTAAKKTDDLDKLVDSKQYFLPINAVEQRRSKRMVVAGILLSLVLLLAWVNIALDAGLIEINGIKPLTHFFST